MLQVLGGSWALFLGMFMLMVGNGLQGTLLGLRGDYEGFSPFQMSIVMSCYFLGFLFASRLAPVLIRRVGHIRVFAAMGSTISAVLILYPTLTDPIAWSIGRVIIGFCYCGVYITAESWLNDASSNENRGKALSLYMLVQMGGIVSAQYIITLGDISGYILFIIPSVLVSLSFAPILLSVRPVPAFDTSKPLKISRLIEVSPLACVGMFVLGGVFSAQFGMTSVFGTMVGLSVSEISYMVMGIYTSGLLLQYPIGWLSDRIGRRSLIIWVAAVGGLGACISVFYQSYAAFFLSAVIVGGTTNPLYALLIAYANDYLDREDMAAASGGFLFINGVGAVTGPLIVGAIMENIGAAGYWSFIALLLIGMTIYALWRTTRREYVPNFDESVQYTPISPSATAVAAEVAQEVYIEAEEELLAQQEQDEAEVA